MKMLERRSKLSPDGYITLLERRACRNSLHTGVIGVAFSILLILFLTSCSDERPTVDFGGDAGREISSTPLITDHRATLRVAIGAMLSPEITRKYYQGLMKLIGARVDRRVIFSQRRTYAEVNELVKTHEVDMAFVCSGPYTKGHQDFGMELLVVPVTYGQRVYHSYILSRHDSDITSFDDLKGRRFAFTDPHSNTGCLVPNYMLARRGETPESYFRETFFTHSHDNSIKAVAEGLADGAAVDSLIWEFMNRVDPADTSRTKIVEKSPPYGIPPIVVHPNLDSDLKQRLKSVFLSIHEDEESVPLLRHIQIDCFAEGEDSMYESVREMQKWLEGFNKEKKN